MGCSSHSGQLIAPSSNLIPLLIGYLSCQYSFAIWVFLKTLPIEKKHDMCLQIKSKEKGKKNRRATDGIKGSGTIFFARGGGNFLFLNQSFSLSMSKFLHLLFSLVVSCFKY